jgi:hypothetical protein
VPVPLIQRRRTQLAVPVGYIFIQLRNETWSSQRVPLRRCAIPTTACGSPPQNRMAPKRGAATSVASSRHERIAPLRTFAFGWKAATSWVERTGECVRCFETIKLFQQKGRFPYEVVCSYFFVSQLSTLCAGHNQEDCESVLHCNTFSFGQF